MKDNHLKVIQLREQEKTYNEISVETGLSKSSISGILKKHFPEIKNQKIREKKSRELYRSAGFKNVQKLRNEAAKKFYEMERIKLTYTYLKKMRSFLDQYFVYYISGLYEGEGVHFGTEFSFCNSDSKLVSAFLKFLREVLEFPEERFTLRLALPVSLSQEECVLHWENICSRKIDSVDQYDVRPQKKSYRHHKNRRYYGTLTVRVKSPNGLKSALREYTY